MGQSALRVPIVVSPVTSSPEGLVRARVADGQGVLLTAARARVTTLQSGWLAIIDQMERPGVLNGYYFSRGGREIWLQLEDGRTARGVITSASFDRGKRVYQVEGSEAISRPGTFIRDVA